MEQQLQMPVSRFTLDNGLRVVHTQDTSTAMVAVDVLYDTGARDEDPEHTGMAHLFEHLMFSGSVNVPDFDTVIEDAGGSNNAWTSNDFTNFYDTLPAQNIETAFYLESDRMLGLAFNPRGLEVQRDVVVEEFKQQCLNRPYGDLFHHLRRMMYGDTHPYSWPTIGKTPEHVAAATEADMRRWFDSHYAPDNAILSVAGNVSVDRVRELANKWFGPIPRRHIAPRTMPRPHFPAADIVSTVYGSVPQTCIVIAWPMDPYGTPDYHCADTITDILSAGRSSRFYRRFMAENTDNIFTGADASVMGSEHEGMLLLTAYLAREDDEAIDMARRQMTEEARRLCTDGDLSRLELERTFNRFESTFRFANMNYLSKAQNLALAEYHGEDINATVSDRRKITVEQITECARHIFSAPSATLIYRPAQFRD